jgi:hypothetical protein
MAKLIKDPSIIDVVAKLQAEGPPGELEIVDEWEADLCAVGLRRSGVAWPRVYVSTWHQPPGRYYAECEFAPAPGSELPVVTRRAPESLAYERLRDLVRTCLGV